MKRINLLVIFLALIFTSNVVRSQHPIETWLDNHPNIKNEINWFDYNPEDRSNHTMIPFDNWDADVKQQLFDFYDELLKGNYPDFTNPLTNLKPENDFGYTQLSPSDGKMVYNAFLASSIYHEINKTYKWSIADYSQAAIKELYDFNGYFTYYREGLLLKINSTPASPKYLIDNFLLKEDIIDESSKQTYVNIVDYIIDNFRHFAGGGTQHDNNYMHWQYHGNPPMSRMIEGTTHTETKLFAHYTAGCHGTVTFTKWLGFLINIPVNYTQERGHAIAILPSVDSLFMSHGDDPYNRLATKPTILGKHLLINKLHYNDFYKSDVSGVGKRTIDISLNSLPKEVLDTYYDDYNSNGKLRENNKLYNMYEGSSITKETLENIHFWDRLHLKILKKKETSDKYNNFNEAVAFETNSIKWNKIENGTENPDKSIFKVENNTSLRGKSKTLLTSYESVEMVVYNTAQETWLGLSGNSGNTLNSMKYSLQIKDNVVKVFEQGVEIIELKNTNSMSISWLKIAIENDQVSYYVNGVNLHQSSFKKNDYKIYFGAEGEHAEINNIYTSK